MGNPESEGKSHSKLLNRFFARQRKPPNRRNPDFDYEFRPSIREIRGNTIIFQDGKSIEADVLICCSGYKLSFPFLSNSLPLKIETDPYRIGLYRHVWPVDLPGLAFLAVVSVNGSLHPSTSAHRLFLHSTVSYRIDSTLVAEAQARWFAKVISGSVQLPDESTMNQDIVDWSAMLEKYNVKYRPMQVNIASYLEEIKQRIHSNDSTDSGI